MSKYRLAINLCWPKNKENMEYIYTDWLLKCKNNGISIIRIMLTSWGINAVSDKADRKLLMDICKMATEYDIEIIITLNTYVNFQKVTLRDFEDSTYSWNNYVYADKYKKIEEFFLDDIKEQQYVKDIICLLKCIKPYKNVSRIELFNEIDQLGLQYKKAVSWVDNLNDYLITIFASRYNFFISLANSDKYFKVSSKTKLNCDLHLYSFPNSTMVGNMKYIQQVNLYAPAMEYAKYSDYSYSHTLESKTYFTAGLWSGFLMNRNQSPASWWWYDILSDSSYINIIQYFLKNHKLYSSFMLSEIGILDFQAMDDRVNEDAIIMKAKIRERLKNLLLKPKYIFDEIGPIYKFFKKKISKKKCRKYEYLSFEAPGMQLYLIETYGKYKVSLNTEIQDNVDSIWYIDLINGIKKKYDTDDFVKDGLVLDGCNLLIYYLI